VQRGAEVVRVDYSTSGWSGPPEESLGWWKSQMPDPKANRLHWAPNDVMLHYFEQLDDADQQDLRYVLALLMLRRRVMRLEDTQTDEHGREVMVLYCPRKECEFHVVVTNPGNERIAEMQIELAELLFAKAE
jgi:hypothetical protein